MPTINNALIGSALHFVNTYDGERKLVRLSNGWLVFSIYTSELKVYVSKNGGGTWELTDISYSFNEFSKSSVAMASKGNKLYFAHTYADSLGIQKVVSFSYKVEEGGFVYEAGKTIDTNQTALANVSLAINEAGTELHAAWSSKNATYRNSFNIRYAKGTINGDGSVTWGAVEQVTTANASGSNYESPCIIVRENYPYIFHHNDKRVVLSTTFVTTKQFNVTEFKSNWSGILVANSNYPTEPYQSAIFVPQSINGLANGRLWVAWHGKDATDSAKFNVRVSYSDDGGVTWANPVKLTSGNTSDSTYASITADWKGDVYVLYEIYSNSSDTSIQYRKWTTSGWGSPVNITTTSDAVEKPNTLVDFRLKIVTPPHVYWDPSEGIKFTGNFNAGASVSPVSGALGNKETPVITAYTVTPEPGSTVTSIIEKVNGVTINTFNNPASLSRTLTVPQATWDTLAYFTPRTASITVTDSNGTTTVTTYSFDKTLGNNASLLEATKANADAKNRISQKRDELAAQVGLSAGSTFDAISAQLASGQAFKKFATGTVTANISGTISVSGLAFKPRIITVYKTSDKYISLYYDSVIQATSYVGVTNSSPVYRTNMSVKNDGFSVTYDMFGGNTLTWTAIE